ncbi:hypothetical protein AB1Y20_021902 [Prymnesium parvum]|uniref:XPG N-terminal domain-containing protein n=1 Tax=Prymnesium parvum TaxID=97485 RepID=A0AB34JES5_PRYPA
MGIKGLSKGVIKQVWRERRLQELHQVRVGVDAAGWIMKSLMSNACDVCLEVEGSVKHHATFARYVQNMLHKLPESSSILLVLDGAQWPLRLQLTREGAIQGRRRSLERWRAMPRTTRRRLTSSFAKR